MSDAVGYRKLAVNGRYIRGFGVPKYASRPPLRPPAAEHHARQG
ncbi:MAG: hypothetical protein ACLSF6_06075 [Evtepia gabavorous]